MFILSDSPPERDVQWSIEGVSASHKFIQKLWKLNEQILTKKESHSKNGDIDLQKTTNKIVYSVTKNLESFQYNVVIANLYETYNTFNKNILDDKISNKVLKNEWEKIMMLLLPIVPHFAHECLLKNNTKFYWPKFDPSLLKEENCIIVIQVDGKKRGTIEMPINSDETIVIEKAKINDNVSKYLNNSLIMKNIYLSNKLVNFITKK
jgi:leucyl-tRNA synthetase